MPNQDDRSGSSGPTPIPPKGQGEGSRAPERGNAPSLAKVEELVGHGTAVAAKDLAKNLRGAKDRAADRLSPFAAGLRAAVQRLASEKVGGQLGRQAHRAADRVESLADYIRRT